MCCAVLWGFPIAFCESGERHNSCERENIDAIVTQEFLNAMIFLIGKFSFSPYLLVRKFILPSFLFQIS